VHVSDRYCPLSLPGVWPKRGPRATPKGVMACSALTLDTAPWWARLVTGEPLKVPQVLPSGDPALQPFGAPKLPLLPPPLDGSFQPLTHRPTLSLASGRSSGSPSTARTPRSYAPQPLPELHLCFRCSASSRVARAVASISWPGFSRRRRFRRCLHRWMAAFSLSPIAQPPPGRDEWYGPLIYRLICPLTWWNAIHQYALVSNAERRCEAK
jgi:hypothetical protein